MKGGKGYQYFGSAKELPGVKELFESAVKHETDKKKKMKRAQRLKLADVIYYGFGEDYHQDLELEARAEAEAREKAINEFIALRKETEATKQQNIKNDVQTHVHSDSDDSDIVDFVLPTQKDIEQQILQKYKTDLLRELAD